MSSRIGRRLSSILSNFPALFALILLSGTGQTLFAQAPGAALSAAQPPGMASTTQPLYTIAPIPNSAQAPIPEKILTLDETLQRFSAAPNTAELRWDPIFGTGIFSVGGHQAAFETGGSGEPGLIILDSRQILSLPSPYLENGVLYFPESFVAALKQAFDNFIQDDQNRYRIAAIIVDPGHGGKDSGAQGIHTVDGKTLKAIEKDINLNASKMLYDRLKAAYPDKRILLTRNSDTFPSLEERGILANSVPHKEHDAIVYISIHANAALDKKSRGYEVYYLSPNIKRNLIDKKRYPDNAEIFTIVNAMMEEEFINESIMIAQSIEKRIGETMGRILPSRGVKPADFAVVRNARMPAVLVELAFVSNEEDAVILTDDAHLRKLTDAIYKGITDYVSTFEGTGGFTVNP
ncbi:N-acetylmuramoyl-L-alanine amidase [Spirochaetia bacterium]|nr:N-acetylmuramoyl-L-alanine amidase [Spirochaetia bacterium]